jgi:hypothetical protein
MKIAVLTPAYGRDYHSKIYALADFHNNKDFILNNVEDVYCGKPCNKRDLVATHYTDIELRYKNLTKVAMEKL